MNRLIIVGNGFDLAHKLPTSYANFVDYIWRNFSLTKSHELFMDLFEVNYGHISAFKSFDNYSFFYTEVKNSCLSSRYIINDSAYGDKSFEIYYKDDDWGRIITVFKFKNSFFELINIRRVNNWVQIEDIYYEILISLIKKDDKFPSIKDINQLNSEFDTIKKLLNHYILENIENQFDFKNDLDDVERIAEFFEHSFHNLDNNPNHNLFLEFPYDMKSDLKSYDKLFQFGRRMNNPISFENLFVDFNYTSTVSNYVSVLNDSKHKYGSSIHIQIHGSVLDSNNPINFGFGDEMDDHYKVIENNGDNKYLDNIKSFMYLNNSNYKKLLDWLESHVFQVFIFGHSCGLSDRTMLNTIFEHSNCKSIKIFYHQYKNNDNFREVSMNISRHFNKKSLMREKLVNKTLCQPLPQSIRFKRKSD